MSAYQDTTFREVQRGFEPWISVAIFGVFVFSTYMTYAFGGPDSAQAVIVSAAIILLVAALMFGAKMITEVRENEVCVQLWPFHRKFRCFALRDLQSAEARTYSPIGEYGGWGIRVRLGKADGAYNLRGNRGVQLVFNDGQRLLIGSQKADELADAINAAMR